MRRRALPSGRDTYRTLADYEDEMKTLADENPGLVRLITLPEQTWLGRDVLGLEIATNVNLNDGRPAFFNMGVHHAREWPSGEHAMEWAYELINGFKAGDARATRIVRESRNIVVPIVNPDGFNASRTAGTGVADGGRDEAVARHRLPRRRRRHGRRVPAQELPRRGPGGRQLRRPRPASPSWAPTRTATTAACGAARARAPIRRRRRTGARVRSPSPRAGTSSRSSRATR